MTSRLLIALLLLLPGRAIEPTITRAEQRVLQRALELADSDPAAAARTVEKARTDESSAALDMTLGQLRLLLGQPVPAARALEAALRKAPDFDRAREALIHAYWDAEDWKKAADTLLVVLPEPNRDAAHYLQLGYAFLQQDRPVSAETAYRQAILLDESTEALIGLGRCLAAQRRFPETRAVVGEVLRRQPDSRTAWTDWVGLHRQLDDPAETLVQIECMDRLGFASAELLLVAGDLYRAENMIEPARTRYARALEAGGADTNLVARVGRRALELEDRDLLRAAASRSGDPRSGDPVLRAGLARLEGRLADAATVYREVLARRPLDGDALLGLAECLAAEPAMARPWLERAAAVPRVQRAALTRMVNLDIGRGEFTAALDAATRLARLAPSPEIESLRRRLRRLLDESTAP